MKNIKTLIIGMVFGAGLTFSTGAMAAISTQVTAVFKDLKIVVNGKTAELDAQPLSYNGTTYLPLREVGNQLGYDVTYKADSATIELSSSIPKSNTIGSEQEVGSVMTNQTATQTDGQFVAAEIPKYSLNSTIEFPSNQVKVTGVSYPDKYGFMVAGDGKRIAVVEMQVFISNPPSDQLDWYIYKFFTGLIVDGKIVTAGINFSGTDKLTVELGKWETIKLALKVKDDNQLQGIRLHDAQDITNEADVLF